MEAKGPGAEVTDRCKHVTWVLGTEPVFSGVAASATTLRGIIPEEFNGKKMGEKGR